MTVSRSKPKLLPCPFCGTEELYTGWTSSSTVGIECRKCHVTLDRELPSRWPGIIVKNWPDDTGKAMDMLHKLELGKAIKTWNKRNK